MAFRNHLAFIYVSVLLFLSYNVDAFKRVKHGKLAVPSLGFSWSNCGPGSDPIQVKSLSVSPDPIDIPGNLTLALSAAVSSQLPTDIRISVVMEKKVAGFYIKVPCIDNVGSCNYGNICEAWAQACPKYFAKYGIPCNCPIPPNSYTIPATDIEITSHLPSEIAGDFRITADLGSGSGHLGCIRLELTLKS